MENNFDSFVFLSGDIGLVSDNNWFGKAIRFFESIWTGKAKYNHAFTMVDGTSCVEALMKIAHSPLSNYKNRVVKIYEIPICPPERAALSAGLLERVNGAYGWDKYPFFILDATTTWIKRTFFRMPTPCFFFTKTFNISNIPVCSELVVWAIHKYTSYRLKDAGGNIVDWKIVTPDYLADLLTLKINQAKVIFES